MAVMSFAIVVTSSRSNANPTYADHGKKRKVNHRICNIWNDDFFVNMLRARVIIILVVVNTIPVVTYNKTSNKDKNSRSNNT